MLNPRTITLVAMVLAAAGARLLPHPPNVTPIAAIALFGGAYFASRWAIWLVPLAALALSDLVIGTLVYDYGFFYAHMPWVYASFAATVGIGLLLRSRRSPLRVASATLGCSLLFFVVSNFGVWFAGTMYPHTAEGLVACYTAAIPFFRNMLIGNTLFVALLFGVFEFAQRRVASLRMPEASAA